MAALNIYIHGKDTVYDDFYAPIANYCMIIYIYTSVKSQYNCFC